MGQYPEHEFIVKFSIRIQTSPHQSMKNKNSKYIKLIMLCALFQALYIYITTFYILSFFAEQFLVCVGGLCAWHIIYTKSTREPSYHRNENSENQADPQNSSNSLIKKRRGPILLKRADFLFTVKKMHSFIHSLSIS